MTPLPKLAPGDIVVPYNGKYPIMTLTNPDGQQDLFVRARKHDHLDIWFADVNTDENDHSPKNVKQYRQRGCVVFIPRLIVAGEGVSISRILTGGNSAQGTIIKLPEGVQYPYEYDTAKLFK